MSRILSCYRLRRPVGGGEKDKVKVPWWEFLRERWNQLRKTPVALPVQLRQLDDLILLLGIPEEWIGTDHGLYRILRAAMEETQSDLFYLEPSLQKKLCMEPEGQWLFDDYGVLGQQSDLYPYQADFFRIQCRNKRQRIVVYANRTTFGQYRELLFELADGRNEMTLLFAEPEVSERFAELLADFEEDLEYEYGLIPQSCLTVQRFLELEKERQEPLKVCDLTKDCRLLTGLLDGPVKKQVSYLDGMPTPEKEKYGAKRARNPFRYQSLAEIWRFQPQDGAQVIDTLNKNSYNTIVKWEKYRRILDRKGMHHGRKEKHIDV